MPYYHGQLRSHRRRGTLIPYHNAALGFTAPADYFRPNVIIAKPKPDVSAKESSSGSGSSSHQGEAAMAAFYVLLAVFLVVMFGMVAYIMLNRQR